MMTFNAARRFLESVTGQNMDDCTHASVSPDEYMEVMWPLNAVFKENIALIKSVTYKKAYEKSADKAIEKFAFGNGAAEWSSIPVGTWRILLERHKQMLVVAAANKAANEPRITVLPQTLSDEHKQAALMLLLLHRMKLPFPVNDQTAVAWLVDGAPAPLIRH